MQTKTEFVLFVSAALLIELVIIIISLKIVNQGGLFLIEYLLLLWTVVKIATVTGPVDIGIGCLLATRSTINLALIFQQVNIITQ